MEFLLSWLPTILTGLGGFTAAIVVGLLKDETSAYLPALTRRTLEAAVDRLPPELQADCRSEWTAHVADIPGKLMQLRAALSFHLAARRMIDLAQVAQTADGSDKRGRLEAFARWPPRARPKLLYLIPYWSALIAVDRARDRLGMMTRERRLFLLGFATSVVAIPIVLFGVRYVVGLLAG